MAHFDLEPRQYLVCIANLAPNNLFSRVSINAPTISLPRRDKSGQTGR
jgi:hypothetical protein